MDLETQIRYGIRAGFNDVRPILVEENANDCGCTGGNIERPAPKRLMTDIEAGHGVVGTILGRGGNRAMGKRQCP